MDVTEALGIAMRLCILFEGMYLRPYLCPAGIPTIGVGSTMYLDGRRVKLTDPPITKEHAMHLLRYRILTEFMPGVLRLAGRIDDPRRLGAITDFVYNLGLTAFRNSTLLRRIKAGRWDLVPTELAKWILVGGKQSRGLQRRRSTEASYI